MMNLRPGVLRFINYHQYLCFLAGVIASPTAAFAQSIVGTPLTSCAVSECRFNQSSGTTTSVGVAITSGFGVSASAQSSSGFNANSSSSLIIDSEAASRAGVNSNSLTNVNSSIQSIGNRPNDLPVTVKMSSDSTQAKTRNGSSDQVQTSDKQSINALNYIDNSNAASNATFDASGFDASQDLRFLGSSSQEDGTEFRANVTPNANVEAASDSSSGSAKYGTGSSSASADLRSRFQADITTSTFVNAFMSSF